MSVCLSVPLVGCGCEVLEDVLLMQESCHSRMHDVIPGSPPPLSTDNHGGGMNDREAAHAGGDG